MSWAVERDAQGMPIRMWWIGRPPKRAPIEVKNIHGCESCGYHFGWHTAGCLSRTGALPPEGLITGRAKPMALRASLQSGDDQGVALPIGTHKAT